MNKRRRYKAKRARRVDHLLELYHIARTSTPANHDGFKFEWAARRKWLDAKGNK